MNQGLSILRFVTIYNQPYESGPCLSDGTQVIFINRKPARRGLRDSGSQGN
ncbi:MAG: hypothetical protein ACQPRH_04210 [Solitalea-like symbiont of Tyrophagus putrescentiae]